MFSKFFSFQKWLTVLFIGAIYFTVQAMAPVWAAQSDELTVALTAAESITFTEAEVAQGRRLFNFACARCHVSGQTYPNPDVGLKLEDLEGATPSRDTVASIVDYMKNPTTYDGIESLLEYHPNTQLLSEYPRMRKLTDEDLKLIAGYILIQANYLPGWGGTKSESHSDLAGYL